MSTFKKRIWESKIQLSYHNVSAETSSLVLKNVLIGYILKSERLSSEIKKYDGDQICSFWETETSVCWGFCFLGALVVRPLLSSRFFLFILIKRQDLDNCSVLDLQQSKMVIQSEAYCSRLVIIIFSLHMHWFHITPITPLHKQCYY